MFGTTFFVLTGLHGAHVTVGIIWLLLLWGRSMQGRLPTEKLRGGRDRRPLLALRRHRVDLHLHRHLPDPVALRTCTSMTDVAEPGHESSPPSATPRRRARSRSSDAAPGRRRGARAPGPAPVRPHRDRPRHPHRVEVATSYLEGDVNSNLLDRRARGDGRDRSSSSSCAWYMHMKQDPPFFRRLFIDRDPPRDASCTASCCSSSRARS